MRVLIIILVCLLLFSVPIYGFTIFLLTDSIHTLFCNNEDWTNPKTRIWFMPATESSSNGKKYGRAYVGFSNQWGQGGVNTEGLAYDWVAGFNETWERKRNPHLQKVKGNPAERMLESCATVEEAIAFFNTYWEPEFDHAKISIADRYGTSVIIGAKAGKLEINQLKHARGFGFGISETQKTLDKNPDPTIHNASSLLQKAFQENGTKYSNNFDF